MSTIKKGLLLLLGLLLIALLYLAYLINHYELMKTPQFDTVAPELPADLSNAVLVFSKTNFFRHVEAIPAANALFRQVADKHGWQIIFSENGAIHNPEDLARFRLIIWNNCTGDVLTQQQAGALQHWVQAGGHWMGIHGAGGTPEYRWQWYPTTLIGTQFIGHTIFPPFPEATMRFNRQHTLTRDLPAQVSRREEWYSFTGPPQGEDLTILATLDEDTYDPVLDLKMGKPHPLVWTHSVGRGKAFYSSLGHRAEAYSEPEHRQLLETTMQWLMSDAP